MKVYLSVILSIVIIIGLIIGWQTMCNGTNNESTKIIDLPEPEKSSNVSVESALSNRRSVRSYAKTPITINELSQILWAAQGITSPSGFRTAPSAGALYPLEVYAVVGDVNDLSAGVYKYQIENHKLKKVIPEDKRSELTSAALGQSYIKKAAVNIVIVAIYERVTRKYGKRGVRYVHMEAGHVSQNIYLQCESLPLGTVAIGAFDDNQVKSVLNLPDKEEPLYIMPVGNISE